MIKKILVIVSLALAFISNAAAQSVIEIPLTHNRNPHKCYANSCFHSAQEKQRNYRLGQTLARNSCSINMTGGNLSQCERDKEGYEAMKQCYEHICARAVCTKMNTTTEECISGAHFR